MIEVASLILEPILAVAAKKVCDAAIDYALKFIGDETKRLLVPDAVARIGTVAVSTFDRELQAELIGCGETELTVKQYERAIAAFLGRPEVARHLGEAFWSGEPAELAVDAGMLAALWEESLPRTVLPDGFRWSALINRYAAALRRVWGSDAKIREIRAAVLAGSTGMGPRFDVAGLARRIIERFARVRLDVLDAGTEHGRLLLVDLFIEPVLRPMGRYSARAHALAPRLRRELLSGDEAVVVADTRSTPAPDCDDQRLHQERVAFFSQPARAALDVVLDEKQRHLLVVGDAGSGKSTLLAVLALRWAQPQTRRDLPLPLVIELKHYATMARGGACSSLVEYIDRCHGTLWRLPEVQVTAALAAGDACLLLDGLDEIPDSALRAQVVNDIASCGTRFPRARIVVTTRLAGAVTELTELREAGFAPWAIQDLDDGQQSAFVNRWCLLNYTGADERAARSGALLRSLAEQPSLREMAGSPLLLTLLMLLGRHRELPRDRGTLLERASQLLLEQWEINKALQQNAVSESVSIDMAEKRAMLCALAMHMQSQEDALGQACNVVAEPSLRRVLRDSLEREWGAPQAQAQFVVDRLIKQLRERSFILAPVGARQELYGFVHRCFLDYFCAAGWIAQFKDAPAQERISLHALRDATFERHWDDEHWTESLALIAAHLAPEDAEAVLLPLLDKPDRIGDGGPVWLVATCFGASRYAARLPQLRRGLLERLGRLAEAGAAPPVLGRVIEDEAVRVRAIMVLARMGRGQPEVLGQLERLMAHGHARDIRAAAMQALVVEGTSWDEAGERVRALAVADADMQTRLLAIETITAFAPEAPATQALLARLVEHDPSPQVRRCAIEQALRQPLIDPAMVPRIVAMVRGDADLSVRVCALESLAGAVGFDLSLRRMTQALADPATPEPLRSTAIELLGSAAKDDHARALLETLVAPASTDLAAAQARAALAKGWPDARTASLLLDLACSDAAALPARVDALALLVGMESLPAQQLGVLMALAAEAAAPALRSAAVEALGALGWGDAQRSALVQRLGREDEDAGVRRAALLAVLAALKTGAGEGRGLLPWLLARLREEADAGLRGLVLRTLASREDLAASTVAAALRQCVLEDPDPVLQVVALDALGAWVDPALDLAWLSALMTDTTRHRRLRRAAVARVARLDRPGPEALGLLLTLAGPAEVEESVRRAALQAMARRWRADAEVSEAMRAACRDDAHWSVRRTAIQELSFGWKEDARTAELLIRCVREDEDPAVRRAGLSALSEVAPRNPAARSLLIDAIVAEADASVRRLALEILLRDDNAGPEMSELLILRAHEDPEPGIRQQALQGLRRRWPTHPALKTLSLAQG